MNISPAQFTTKKSDNQHCGIRLDSFCVCSHGPLLPFQQKLLVEEAGMKSQFKNSFERDFSVESFGPKDLDDEQI